MVRKANTNYQQIWDRDCNEDWSVDGWFRVSDEESLGERLDLVIPVNDQVRKIFSKYWTFGPFHVWCSYFVFQLIYLYCLASHLWIYYMYLNGVVHIAGASHNIWPLVSNYGLKVGQDIALPAVTQEKGFFCVFTPKLSHLVACFDKQRILRTL